MLHDSFIEFWATWDKTVQSMILAWRIKIVMDYAKFISCSDPLTYITQPATDCLTRTQPVAQCNIQKENKKQNNHFRNFKRCHSKQLSRKWDELDLVLRLYARINIHMKLKSRATNRWDNGFWPYLPSEYKNGNNLWIAALMQEIITSTYF